MACSLKTLVVQLDRLENGDVGMHVDALTLAICLVESQGLVASWNASHPHCAIEPGDRLVSVNGLCHPEVVMEQLATEFSMRLVVEKKGGLGGALVPHSKFAVQLVRSGGELGPTGFGFEVNAESLEVLSVADDGPVAQWNLCHPFRAIALGDRILEINGEVHAARHEVLMEAPQVDLMMVRSGQTKGTKEKGGLAAFGTFGVSLQVGSEPVGFGVSFSTLEVEKVEATGAVQKWNAANPINKLRLGDRVIQVNGKVELKSILAELKAQKDLKLVVARAERRVDQNRALLTFKECQAAWPKDPDRWRKMPRIGGPASFAQVSALVASSFIVELRRSKDQDWGFEVQDSRLRRVHDAGLLAQWNWRCPSKAVIHGDQVMVNGLSENKAVQQNLKQSLTVQLTVSRQGAITSTFGISLVKTFERKLGLKLSDEVEIIKIDPGGALALWNASHPLLEVHLGDRILQVGDTVSRQQIFKSLQSAVELEFLLGRCERRLDTTGRVLSLKECEAAYGQQALARWSHMQPVPEGPEHVRDATQSRQYLAGTEQQGENRSLLASDSFYRTLADVQPSAQQRTPMLPAPPAPAASGTAGTMEMRSVFSCPCCHRLFHVFMEDGIYHALPAAGALAAVRVKPPEDWNVKVQVTDPPPKALPSSKVVDI